jgi:hypothetical protein
VFLTQFYNTFDHGKQLILFRIFRANDFLSRATNFCTDHIQNLSNDRKIRIAILDTGINEYHPFFKGVKATRRARDSPFKGMQSFIGDSNAADSFGHGTNVASLILRIAREANLYIAKISKGQEEEGPEPIVKVYGLILNTISISQTN